MRVHEGKWLNREIELLPHVESYASTMHILVDRCRPKHSADHQGLRKTLKSAAHIIFQHYRALLKAIRPGDEADVETKCRYNLTVTRMKREHERVLASIEEKFDEWR